MMSTRSSKSTAQKKSLYYVTRKDEFIDCSSKLLTWFDFVCVNIKIKFPKKNTSFFLIKSQIMVIGFIDVSYSEIIEHRLVRRVKIFQRESKSSSGFQSSTLYFKKNITVNVSSSTDDVKEFSPPKKPKKTNSEQRCMAMKIVNLAIACNWMGVSGKATYLIPSAVIQNVGIDSKNTINWSKLRRARKSTRSVKLDER